MTSRTKLFLLTFLPLTLLSACKKDDDSPSPVIFSYHFTNDAENWRGDFADYPTTDNDFYDLVFEYSKLPSPLDVNKGALKISGNNHSDDLFMFIKRQISGLKPNQNYQVGFAIEFASSAPTNAVGVGGPPGEAVCMKVGATAVEPFKINPTESGDTYYRMNIDKGNQALSGSDMINIGHVGVADNTTQFTLITRNSPSNLFKAKTDAQGNIWVIIGTDSGFESTTTLYYNKIEVSFYEL